MSLVGFRSRNHPQQVGTRGSRPDVDDRAITRADFAPLHERFRFTVDAAASKENARLPRYWTAQDDALSLPWDGERVWCNPPYSHPNLEAWTAAAWDKHTAAGLIVMLVPANRTEQQWWQRNVEPFRDRSLGLRTEFLPGRIRFLLPGQLLIGPDERPPFGCCLLIWQRGAETGSPDLSMLARSARQPTLFDSLGTS
jgi:phage N-6-adenine-methyltransferase